MRGGSLGREGGTERGDHRAVPWQSWALAPELRSATLLDCVPEKSHSRSPMVPDLRWDFRLDTILPTPIRIILKSKSNLKYCVGLQIF